LAQIRSQPFFEARDKSADLIEFYGLSGLGNAESANLIVDDVDFAKNTVQVLRVKTGQGFLIPIYPQLLPLLTRLHAEAISRGDKKLFQVKEAETALENACRRLGFPHFTPRSLRRMFITRALELGIDVKVVAELQGHRDGGKLILQTYSHVNRPHLESMAQRLK
jgi:integrase